MEKGNSYFITKLKIRVPTKNLIQITTIKRQIKTINSLKNRQNNTINLRRKAKIVQTSQLNLVLRMA